MARIPIAMANLGYDMESGRIASWSKQVGDSVRRGDVLAEVETDKATVDMEAIDAGTLVEIVHAAGSAVTIGETIGYLDDGV
jgi:pyruvate dehydrogenase E2 component (dihydrolipoamide acetyltransferase)